jgi:hypothetical protein
MVGKPEGKGTFGKLRRKWKDNMKMDIKEIGWECLEWIYLAQDKHSSGGLL